MKTKPLIFSCLVLLLMVSCGKENKRQSKFVSTAGNQSFFHGKIQVEVTVSDNLVKYSINRGSDTTTKDFQKGTTWFIFPESQEKVWIYDGNNSLTLVQFMPKKIKVSDTSMVPSLCEQAPIVVRNRLPDSIKK